MSGKVLLLLAVEYFVVYVAGIANIFPRSAEPMGQMLFAVEILGAGLAVLLFVSAGWYFKAVSTSRFRWWCAVDLNLNCVDTFLDKLVNWDYANAKYKGQDAGVEE